MAHLGFSYPDKPYDSFWGPQSSHYNFCEEDFLLTPYIAEVINTITNLTYIIYACHGFRKNHARPDAILRNMPYAGILGVGIGSAIFHTTNLYYTQWFDDLSMLFAIATVMHRVYTYDRPLKTAVWSAVGTTVFLIAFSVYHCYMDEVVMHGLLFGVSIIVVGAKTRSIIAQRVSDPWVKKEVRRLVWWGAGSFAFGWACWNVDYHACGTETEVKRWIGMPLSFLGELHGWWHIFTGIGAYIFIALVEYLTSEDAGEDLHGRFAWPVEKVCLRRQGVETPRLRVAEGGNGHINEEDPLLQ